MMDRNEEDFQKLQKFSGELIKLGQEIEKRLRKKEEIELEIADREKEARALQTEIFQLKEDLIKLNVELQKLEGRRRQIEGRG